MNEPFTVTEFSTMASGKSSWVAQLADIMLQRGTLIMSRTCYCKQDAEIDARALNAAYALGVRHVQPMDDDRKRTDMNEPFAVRARPAFYFALSPSRIYEPWQAYSRKLNVRTCQRETKEQALADARALNAAYALGVQYGRLANDSAGAKETERRSQ